MVSIQKAWHHWFLRDQPISAADLPHACTDLTAMVFPQASERANAPYSSHQPHLRLNGGDGSAEIAGVPGRPHRAFHQQPCFIAAGGNHDQKVHAGQWHPTAIRLVEELIKEREAYLAFGHAELRAGIRAEIEAGDDFNDWEPVAEALHPNTDAVGYFTDREWKKEPAPKADPLEQEMVDYGMRYGLSREESEDIYEWYADEPRANIRQQMRQRAGHEECLPEGESIERKDKDEEIPF